MRAQYTTVATFLLHVNRKQQIGWVWQCRVRHRQRAAFSEELRRRLLEVRPRRPLDGCGLTHVDSLLIRAHGWLLELQPASHDMQQMFRPQQKTRALATGSRVSALARNAPRIGSNLLQDLPNSVVCGNCATRQGNTHSNATSCATC